MNEARRADDCQDVLPPREIRELYELHSHRSTAVNEVLMGLRSADDSSQQDPGWEEALRVNLLSMWLHQVLSFQDATRLFLQYAREVARERGIALPDSINKRKTNARRLWPSSGSAREVYRNIAELGGWWQLHSDRQFKHELTVAPRHYVWRDAWAHRGGRLREYDEGTYAYFRERSALLERDGSCWPREPAWREARESFRQLVDILASAE